MKLASFVIALMLALWATGPAQADDAESGYVNVRPFVKQFGKPGDLSEAIQKAIDVAGGKRNVDIKFYFCGVRITGPQSSVTFKKGDYFVLDFLRLEAE